MVVTVKMTGIRGFWNIHIEIINWISIHAWCPAGQHLFNNLPSLRVDHLVSWHLIWLAPPPCQCGTLAQGPFLHAMQFTDQEKAAERYHHHSILTIMPNLPCPINVTSVEGTWWSVKSVKKIKVCWFIRIRCSFNINMSMQYWCNKLKTERGGNATFH